ncbi:MAG: two-component system cell cycle sensor histidine kinase/response regulator CckA [Planctomycetota bacterium]
MAAVQGIVKSHNGAIYLKSEIGKGTVFRVILPRSTGVAEQPCPIAVKSRAEERKTVLLVDDESAVREVNSSILERAGFDFLTATGW